MWRLLFLSTISALAIAGCGDDCGPGGASDFGLLASDANVQLSFGNLSSSMNNDCPDPSAPAGVISLTLMGSQKEGGGLITLCVPRPDTLSSSMVTIGTGLKIIDLNGSANGCMFTFDSSRPASGTARATGMCDNGKDPAGFALIVDGNISLKQDCAGTVSYLALAFTGTSAVSVR